MQVLCYNSGIGLFVARDQSGIQHGGAPGWSNLVYGREQW